MKIEVIYEDNHLLVLNKPAGILVHGDQTGDFSLLDWGKKYLKKKYDKPGDVFLGVTHRLDRPASGTVILARTSKALTRLNELHRQRAINKQYFAITKASTTQPSGILKHYLLKDRKKNQVKTFENPGPGRKLAELKYSLISQLEGYALYSIELITGRSHQIRAQLSAMNSPIVGDLKYGYPEPQPDKSIALHCSEMKLIHPVKKEAINFLSSPFFTHPWNIFWEYFR